MDRPTRYQRLDEIRGLTLISMMLYHFLWDLVYIAGIDIPWYHGKGAHIWQQSICWTFIFLSGFCWSLGRHQLKRGLTVFLSGGLVTAVTLIFLPEDRVVFGVLTLLGSSTLLLIPFHRLFAKIKNRVGLTAGLLASALLFYLSFDINSGSKLLPEALYANYFTTYLGFPMKGFFSTDYFSLIPWFFLFLTGYFTHRLLFAQGRTTDNPPVSDGTADTPLESAQISAPPSAPDETTSPPPAPVQASVPPAPVQAFLTTRTIPYADFLGRHSLLIYLLHQPVLYGVTLLIIYMK